MGSIGEVILVMLHEKMIDLCIIVISPPLAGVYCMQRCLMHVSASNVLLYMILYGGNCIYIYIYHGFIFGEFCFMYV